MTNAANNKASGSVPQRFIYWVELSSSATYNNADTCMFWNAFADSLITRNAGDIKGKLLTLQWYLIRAKFTAVHANKKMNIELDIMSTTNPFSSVQIFNGEIYSKQASLPQKCTVRSSLVDFLH